MGAVEDAVDVAADFVGPYVDKSGQGRFKEGDDFETNKITEQALLHLQAINTADLAADPDAPYDASLAGVVYGLLDLITVLGILPHLSPNVAFSQRPRSVLTTIFPTRLNQDMKQLSKTTETLVLILEQKGSGVQPLLNQRILPDIVAALAELSFSPKNHEKRHVFIPTYDRIMEGIPTSRLLPILTTFLQQPLPTWLKSLMSKQLAMMPLRRRGVRHTIEFLSLSYLSKSSQVHQDASGSQSQMPIPVEAVTHASRLLVLPPNGTYQDEWLRQLAPQLWALLDGDEGVELSRAAGQIIAGGILSKRATGAPDTVGWQLFAQPLLKTICPKDVGNNVSPRNTNESVLIQEKDLETALTRLSTIVLSYSHVGLLRRLIGPILLPIWALLNYSNERPALNQKWALLSKSILSRYMAVACDPLQIDKIATDIFWNGNATWTFKPGSQGGVEIRRRSADDINSTNLNNILTRMESLDSRINLIVSLFAEAKTPDEIVGAIFLQTTKRWLSPIQKSNALLADDLESDPFAALTNAKLSEAMGTKFRKQFARSPQHIIELMGQLLFNFVNRHQIKAEKLVKPTLPTRVNLRDITKAEREDHEGMSSEDDAVDEELISFAVSILNTLISSPDFKQTPETRITLARVIASLVYLSHEQSQLPISPMITSSATTLLQLLQPSPSLAYDFSADPAVEHRTSLKVILRDLTSPEAPDRTWALHNLHKIIQDPGAFPVIDVPSTVHLLLSASLADPESYVHIAAMPVLVDLAIRAPNPVVRVLAEAFADVDERSLKLDRGRQTEEKDKELQQALDFRLRVGEVLDSYIIDSSRSHIQVDTASQYRCLKQVSEVCLSLASRRGQRTQALSKRTRLAHTEQQLQEEGELAWGGPIPNLLDPDSENSQDQAERDALFRIVQAWEDTGIEEDVRIRASALSVLSTIFEHRFTLLRQVMVDAALQMVLLIVTVETSEGKGVLRRAAVLVIMGLLRSLDSLVEDGEESAIGLGMTQQDEVARVLKWVVEEDVDELVRDHAANVLEALDTWRFKKLYRLREGGSGLGADLTLTGNLRGLDVQPELNMGKNAGRKLIVEEME